MEDQNLPQIIVEGLQEKRSELESSIIASVEQRYSIIPKAEGTSVELMR